LALLFFAIPLWSSIPLLPLGGRALQFFGDLAPLTNKTAFRAHLKPLRNIDGVVYAKRPFAGPKQVLRYLSRYTHRVVISNRRLISADEKGVTFRYKNYRLDGSARYKTMTLATDEFIRRFLIHVPPWGSLCTSSWLTQPVSPGTKKNIPRLGQRDFLGGLGLGGRGEALVSFVIV
jgi:hypothetical protein